VPQSLSSREISESLDEIERSKAVVSADLYRVNCPTLTESEITRIVGLVCATRIRLIAERALCRLPIEAARQILGEFESSHSAVSGSLRGCSHL
jgi:hypothetical protein